MIGFLHSPKRNGFIESTANDYDMTYSFVENLYGIHNGATEEFYNALESELKRRRNE